MLAVTGRHFYWCSLRVTTVLSETGIFDQKEKQTFSYKRILVFSSSPLAVMLNLFQHLLLIKKLQIFFA